MYGNDVINTQSESGLFQTGKGLELVNKYTTPVQNSTSHEHKFIPTKPFDTKSNYPINMNKITRQLFDFQSTPNMSSQKQNKNMENDESLLNQISKFKSTKIILLFVVIFIFSKLIQKLIDFFAITTIYGYSLFAYFILILVLWSILPQTKSYIYQTNAILSNDTTKFLIIIVCVSVFYLYVI